NGHNNANHNGTYSINADNEVELNDYYTINTKLPFLELLPYYLPCFSWIPDYSMNKFFHDLIAGLTLASFQIPISISYANTIAHAPTICGLYGLIIPPFIYAILGSVPQMIVGPEAAISLVVGQTVDYMRFHHSEEIQPIDIVVIMSMMAGFFLFFFGLFRFGYVENVLSKSLLNGFICAVGMIMIINSLFGELKLDALKSETLLDSPYDKFVFIIHQVQAGNYHWPTVLLSGVSLLVVLVIRRFKKKGGFTNSSQTFQKILTLFPEILAVVIITTIFSYEMDFKGRYKIQHLGAVTNEEGKGNIVMKNPFSRDKLRYYDELLFPSLTIGILGFLESTTASQSLGSIYNLPISANRELVALGMLNIAGSFFSALASFGGYGRSKINALSGARTTISGFVMGFFTLLTTFFMLKYFHYLPMCILSVITTVVGINLLMEVPGHLVFHWRDKGWNELLTFFITLSISIFYSVESGIIVGCGYSVLRVVKHSSKSRIQILGRVPNTNHFTNADEQIPEGLSKEEFQFIITSNRKIASNLEEIEGCLIIKIPEPLTFTNTSDLKIRLNRLEKYGSIKIHPATNRIRKQSMTRYVIFDMHGMTELDSSAAQILKDIVINYSGRGIYVLFCRVARSKRVRERLFDSGI
ncbi:uncharacterized protein ASCRUDRAFT_22612, partial [Ascoidea rubescens DSM 1968]